MSRRYGRALPEWKEKQGPLLKALGNGGSSSSGSVNKSGDKSPKRPSMSASKYAKAKQRMREGSASSSSASGAEDMVVVPAAEFQLDGYVLEEEEEKGMEDIEELQIQYKELNTVVRVLTEKTVDGLKLVRAESEQAQIADNQRIGYLETETGRMFQKVQKDGVEKFEEIEKGIVENHRMIMDLVTEESKRFAQQVEEEIRAAKAENEETERRVLRLREETMEMGKQLRTETQELGYNLSMQLTELAELVKGNAYPKSMERPEISKKRGKKGKSRWPKFNSPEPTEESGEEVESENKGGDAAEDDEYYTTDSDLTPGRLVGKINRVKITFESELDRKGQKPKKAFWDSRKEAPIAAKLKMSTIKSEMPKWKDATSMKSYSRGVYAAIEAGMETDGVVMRAGERQIVTIITDPLTEELKEALKESKLSPDNVDDRTVRRCLQGLARGDPAITLEVFNKLGAWEVGSWAESRPKCLSTAIKRYKRQARELNIQTELPKETKRTPDNINVRGVLLSQFLNRVAPTPKTVERVTEWVTQQNFLAGKVFDGILEPSHFESWSTVNSNVKTLSGAVARSKGTKKAPIVVEALKNAKPWEFGYSQGSKGNGRNAAEALVCSKCFQVGHGKQDCKNDYVCNYCHESGHVRKDCPQLKKDGATKPMQAFALMRKRTKVFSKPSAHN